MHADSVNGEAWAMVACMMIQTVVRASIPLSSAEADVTEDLTSSNSRRPLRDYHLVNYPTHKSWSP